MITVNAMGDVCPIPVIKTRKAIGELGGSGQIEVLVDNETAVRNVTKMAESSGAAVSAEKLEEGKYRVNITVGAGARPSPVLLNHSPRIYTSLACVFQFI